MSNQPPACNVLRTCVLLPLGSIGVMQDNFYFALLLFLLDLPILVNFVIILDMRKKELEPHLHSAVSADSIQLVPAEQALCYVIAKP